MNHNDGVAKVNEIMKDAGFCMMTTHSLDGKLVSRPMALQEVEFDGDVWFLTYNSSPKVAEITANDLINVSFNSKNSWVSLSGNAEVIKDTLKVKGLWSTPLKAWFPEGPEDPNIRLIKVHADTAEFWDAANNKLVTLFGLAKATVSHTQAKGGENETVKM